MLFIRSALFNFLFYLNTIVLMIVGLPTMIFGRRAVLSLARLWSRSSLWLLRVTCGTSAEFRGLENIPKGACIVAPKHQSFWETFALVNYFDDFSYVLKRELTFIPFFGWYLLRGGQIAIDRANAQTALRQLTAKANALFAEGRQLFIFPEGTRRAPGAPPAYKAGVAYVYDKTGVPCIPVALNAGLFWPRRRFLRFPGTIQVEFLPVIAPGLKRDAFLQELQRRIETATDRLIAEAARQHPETAAFSPSKPTPHNPA
ncbi:MAG: 1-acyl-sn-glycerol-3-phosphate acyltransferase [Methylobacteriaceae bacterium]|nr:1-acyl-sn-glycerol-3-phosphate acyltransferase [Methylobacteriaceae bacterium]